ncbi:MAG: PxKF domain-containing protein [Vicinamibacterales bacterium]
MPSSVLAAVRLRSRLFAAAVAAVLAVAGGSYLVSANASASVTTEDAVHAGGDEVMIRAQGFAPDEAVSIAVVHADGAAEPGMGHEPFTARADAGGVVVEYWTLQAADAGSRQFVVRVTGATSGVVVSPAFARAARVEPSTRQVTFGSPLILKGRDFAAGETVTIQVRHADGTAEPDGAHEPFSVVVAADGTFVAPWTGRVEDSGPSTLAVSFDGSLSGPAEPLALRRSAALRTDKDDYMPAETASIAGSGFVPGEAVELQVRHLTGPDGGNGHAPFYATADANGAVAASWFVDPDDSLGATFVLSGKGAVSGALAEWVFTDAGSTTLVLSEVYGAGGNSGAVFTNDYIQIFNRSASPVSLNGKSLQYASATGTGNLGATNQITVLPNVTLQPGQYFLVKEAGGATGVSFVADLAPATGAINMSGSAGKVALVNSTTSLGCNGGSAPCSAAQQALIIDLLGFGTANFFEGSAAAPALTASTAASRKAAGCTDSDDNAADFAALTLNSAAPPATSASPFSVCATSTTPSLSINDVSQNEGNAGTTTFSFTVSLSVPAGAGGVGFDIATADNTATTANNDYTARSLTGQTIPAGSSSYTFDVTVNGDALVEPNETFFVNVTNVTGATVSDAQGQGTIVNEDVPPPVHIAEIQGAGHVSPLAGQTVTTTASIVTALRNVTGTRGFYIQDIAPDADDATSDGVFVFTGSTSNPGALVSVGDIVTVRGAVTEFRPSAGSLTITEISSTAPVLAKLSTGNALPAPVVLGSGGRAIPDTIIEDDATNVETTGTFDPASDGIDFWESLEGMLVRVNDAVVVGPTGTNGSGATTNHDIPVLVDNGAAAGIRTTRGGIVIRANDYNPERITFNDLITGGPQLPQASVSDTFPGPITGIIDYSFNNPKLEVISLPPLVSGGLAREVTNAPAFTQLAVATFNVENLAPSDPPAKFAALAGAIVQNLASPDVLAIEEIQDDNGTTNNGTVTAGTTWSTLIAAIQAAGGPVYDYRQIDPVNGQDGGAPGGNIRQGFLFRTDRGLAFVDRAGAGSLTANAVMGTGASTQLLYSPGRIDPTNPAFGSSRKPLAGEFTFRGRTVFVIANHFTSKGGDDPLFGVIQPPVLSSETQRVQQAQVEAAFVAQILAADPGANIVVLGDLNDFEFSNPVSVLKGAGLQALIETLPQAERYSYVFEGNSQALDHIMVSGGLFAKPFDYDIVHINSEFWDQISDHDPQVVHLTFNQAPTVSAGGPYTVTLGQSAMLTGAGADPDGDALTYAWDLDNDGTFETAGQTASFATGSRGIGTYTISLRVTDAGGLSTVASTTVDVNFAFAGFFPPVQPMPVFTVVDAGTDVFLKFSLAGFRGYGVMASVVSTPVDCTTLVPTGANEPTRLDGRQRFALGDYTFIWNTTRRWAGQCRLFTLTTSDAEVHQAIFRFR